MQFEYQFLFAFCPHSIQSWPIVAFMLNGRRQQQQNLQNFLLAQLKNCVTNSWGAHFRLGASLEIGQTGSSNGPNSQNAHGLITCTCNSLQVGANRRPKKRRFASWLRAQFKEIRSVRIKSKRGRPMSGWWAKREAKCKAAERKQVLADIAQTNGPSTKQAYLCSWQKLLLCGNSLLRKPKSGPNRKAAALSWIRARRCATSTFDWPFLIRLILLACPLLSLFCS